MKNAIFLVLAALLFTVSVQAQTTVDSIAAKYKLIPMPEPLTIEKTFPVLGSYQLATDASATTSAAVTTDASASTMTTSFSNNVTITLDSVNKGVIWVSGLPQGTFKAYLKRSPATYRVLAQKTDAGKEIPEGTLMFDPETRALNIALGKDFDEVDPAAIFALNPALNTTASTDVAAPADNEVKIKVKTPTSKTKSKVTFITATKLDAQTTTSSNVSAPATDAQSQSQSTQQSNGQPAQQQPNSMNQQATQQ
jgi:hypothetical protein